MSWGGSEKNRWLGLGFFSEPPQLIRDSHYMVLPQTFLYNLYIYICQLLCELMLAAEWPLSDSSSIFLHTLAAECLSKVKVSPYI